MQEVKRLINQIKPTHYDLTLKLDTQEMAFDGNVAIKGNLPTATSSITLHASELDITSISLSTDNQEKNNLAFTLHHELQELEVHLPDQFTGEVILTITFNGKITRPMHGLYPCFFSHNGEDKKLFATQFESHHAREVFPCVDEPEAKATFDLTLITKDQPIVRANTPEISSDILDGWKTTKFATTPIMSTYLLAFICGDFVSESIVAKSGISISAFASPVHAQELSFALEVADKTISFLNDYFAIPYPLEKLDIVALPDFAAGAMENWGLITFRESAMLIDHQNSDLLDKQHVAEVVIHELAHQWFGNLVTMRWWNDLWLNEGFASFIPYIVMDSLFPEWRVWELFSSTDLAAGLKSDALENTHPIVVDIHNPEEIRSAFDTISYSKGCSVINLVYRMIGPDAFRNGLREYLASFAYKNAETHDLWNSWSQASGKDVVSFMSTWTTKPGFPIIKVDASDGNMRLSQERFFISPSHPFDETIWQIPLLQSENDLTLMTEKQQTVPAIGKINLGQSGFYRVRYDEDTLASLKETIVSSTMQPVDVLGIITDTAESAKAGHSSTVELLDILSLVGNYTNEKVHTTTLLELAAIRTVMPELHDALKPLTAKIIGTQLDRLGFETNENEDSNDELLRPSILGAASYAGNKEVISKSLEIFATSQKPEDIRPELRSLVYQTAVRELNDKTTYETLFSWYKSTTLPGEHAPLAAALLSFDDIDFITRSLDLIDTPSVKLQDVLYWLMYGLSGRKSRDATWRWLKSHWSYIAENFSRDKEIDYFLKFAANGFASQTHRDDFEQFFSSVDIFGSERAFKQGLEILTWQTAWKERDLETLKNYLSSK